MRTVYRLLAAGTLAAASFATPAAAATIIGGATEVTLTSAATLTGLGLSFAPYGTASLLPGAGDPVVSFLITGGTADTVSGDLLVRHDGSGLDFTAGSNTLRIGDFVVDTAAALVSGSAVANGTALGVVPLFNLNGASQLLLTSQAAGAFTSVFGAPDLTGAVIGVADVNAVLAVPEPSSWALMIGGFVLAGAAVRRRRPAVSYA